MSPFKFIKGYYSLFGSRGVWLAAQARLQHTFPVVGIRVPGIEHPVHIRLRTSDISSFRQVLATPGYDCDFVRSPLTIVDAGANIGLTSLFYANKYPEAKILAIEPEASNYTLLKKNAAPYPKMIPVQRALWKSCEELSIIDSGLGDWGFQAIANAGSELVVNRGHAKSRGTTVDMLMKEYDIDYIDLLKVDIEGSEKEVFENADTWIDKVGAIAIELHDGLKPGCSRAFSHATREFETICHRGETLFVARQRCMLSVRSAMQGSGEDSTKKISRLPCKIVDTV